MGKIAAFLGTAVVGAAAALGLGFAGFVPGLSPGMPNSATGNAEASSAKQSPATAAPPSRVVALARLEPAAGVIELGGVPGDRIERILVKPGQTVRRDDELVQFESRKLREWELNGAKSQLAEATARLQAEQAYADALIRTAQLAVDSLTLDDLELSAQRTRLKALAASAETARRDYERVAKLSASVASPQEVDHARLLREQAEIELAAAGEQLKKLEAGRDLRRREAEAGLDQARAGRAKVDAAVPLDSLRVAVGAAEERLRLAVLRAPAGGTVLEIPADAGDTVGPTPIIRLADVSALTARAEVYETQIRAVRPGQAVRITADALAAPLDGTVEQISSVVGRNRLTSLDPRRSTDDRVVETIIRLRDPAAAAQFIHLQVTATIETEQK